MNSAENGTKQYPFLNEGENLVDRQLYLVPLKDLEVDQEQPRKYFDEGSLDEMVASIKEHGVLQPVIFRVNEEGQLVLVSGERRYRAAQAAALDCIPAIYHEGTDKAVIALVENLMREDLTVIEEAEAVERLKNERSYNQEEISRVIGKKVPTISEILKVASLPQEIRDECRSNRDYSRRGLLTVARMGTLEETWKAFKKLKARMGSPEDDECGGAGTEKVSPVEGWVKKIDKLSESLQKVDLESFGDERSQVEGALKKLAAQIKKTIKKTV